MGLVASGAVSNDDFTFDIGSMMDPPPDDEAWEAYLLFALDILGGDDDNGLTNDELGELEGVLGVTLPFEVGLLLVMGVPDDARWHRWNDDPAAKWADWNTKASRDSGRRRGVDDRWVSSWGQRPDEAGERSDAIATLLADAPPLLPLYDDRAIPLTTARDVDVAESNPVLSIEHAGVTIRGTDLANWLHREFDVPLPMWPETAARSFPFWSELPSS